MSICLHALWNLLCVINGTLCQPQTVPFALITVALSIILTNGSTERCIKIRNQNSGEYVAIVRDGSGSLKFAASPLKMVEFCHIINQNFSVKEQLVCEKRIILATKIFRDVHVV